MRAIHIAIIAAIAMPTATRAQVQVIPAGLMQIDGLQVNCGGYPTILTPLLPDSAMFNGEAILLNPAILSKLPTTLKLFIYGHECGHAVVGLSETSADCWSVQTGRDQGWFPPEAFDDLMVMFHNNPGSVRHPPGHVRVTNMISCYQNP
jgi:hypothetical protein